jgi:ELWxxDGT repeat protein
LTVVGDQVAVAAAAGAASPGVPASGWQLWASDGTGTGTRQLTQLTPTSFDGTAQPVPLAVLGSLLYFVAPNSTGEQVWSTDMTPAGTKAATDFDGQNLGEPTQLVQWTSHLILATRTDHGPEVWTFQPGNPASVAPLCPGGCGLVGSLVAAKAGIVFIRNAKPDEIDELDLMVTDGTPAGSTTLKPDLCDGICSSAEFPLAALNGTIYVPTGDLPGQGSLWQTDGTVQGTQAVASLAKVSCGPLLGTVQGKLLVDGYAAPRESPDLWVSDGTASGTLQLTFESDAYPQYAPSGLVASGNRIFFQANGVLFTSDGTVANTRSFTQDPLSLPAAVSGGIVFVSFDLGAQELWFSDGTAAGTRQITTVAPLEVATFPLSAAGGTVSFAVQSLEGGITAVWRTDGTVAGTAKAFDLPPSMGTLSSLVTLGTDVYFSGTVATANDLVLSLWKAAGSPPRLVHLADFTALTADPTMVELGGLVYFTVGESSFGQGVLYQTDGTPAGTVPVDLGGQDFLAVTDLTVAGQALYFFAAERGACVGLWRLGGGTLQRLAPFCSQVTSTNLPPMPYSLTPVAGGLAFAADDGTHGTELWWTDGTAAGTRLVSDISPGTNGSNPRSLVAAGSRLYFTADDGVHGDELWRSDGTAAGTRMVQDIAPGPNTSQPANLTVAGNFLYFTADDGLLGDEVWAMPLAAGATACQPSATALCLLGGRFRVDVVWNDFQTVDQYSILDLGQGQASPLTDDTGTFWFFDSANVELVVKMLDGRGLNDSFWVFYGALSNVQYAITVTDTMTGLTRRYLNPYGQLASVGDTTAFGPDGATGVRQPPPTAPALARTAAPTAAPTVVSPAVTAAASAGPCVPGPRRLCLDGNRFTVEADWTDFNGATGFGRQVPLSPLTGYFWFFDAANVETMVKIVDGRALNGKFWFFYGALSDVAYTLTITDTTTGTVKTYSNPAGQFASVADTTAF